MNDPVLDKNDSTDISTDIDKVYNKIEGKGRYKYLVFAAATIAYLCHMFYLFAIPFFLIRPNVMCDFNGEWHECTRDEVCSNEGVYYEFDKPDNFNFVTEFGWYCDDTTPPFFTASAFFMGTFSVIIIISISDTIGRLPLLMIGTIGNMLGLILLVVFANPTVVLISSFIIGFFTMANNSSSFNYVADSVPEKYRDTLPTIMNICWSSGEIVLALIMWTGITWREMCLFIFIFSCLFFIPLYWIRESPKFYFVQGKTKKAQIRLNHIMNINGTESENIILRTNQSAGNVEQISFGKRMNLMCCDFSMLKQILLVTFMFVIGNMIFYAMSLNLENMGGNPYVNGIFLAASEVVAIAVGGFSLKIISAKLALSISFALCCIGLFGLTLFWDDPIFSIVFCIFGKLGSASIDNLLYTLSGIFFPTEILGGALGIALFGVRFGNLASKPMYLLGPKLMCIVLLIMGIVATILPWFLAVKKEEKKEGIKAVETA